MLHIKWPTTPSLLALFGFRRLSLNALHLHIETANWHYSLTPALDFEATHPGHYVALDTVVKQDRGRRRYIFTAIDLHSRLAFTAATSTASSKAAAEFLQSALLEKTPFEVEHVLTDNGNEFHGTFEELLQERDIKHLWTWPNTPKMNACVERFNRTLQEELVSDHQDLLFTNLGAFNRAMWDNLHWYNTKRPHAGISLRPPLEVLAEWMPENSNMCWHHAIIPLLLYTNYGRIAMHL